MNGRIATQSATLRRNETAEGTFAASTATRPEPASVTGSAKANIPSLGASAQKAMPIADRIYQLAAAEDMVGLFTTLLALSPEQCQQLPKQWEALFNNKRGDSGLSQMFIGLLPNQILLDPGQRDLGEFLAGLDDTFAEQLVGALRNKTDSVQDQCFALALGRKNALSEGGPVFSLAHQRAEARALWLHDAASQIGQFGFSSADLHKRALAAFPIGDDGTRPLTARDVQQVKERYIAHMWDFNSDLESLGGTGVRMLSFIHRLEAQK